MNQQRIKTLQNSVDYAQKQLNELLKDIVIQVGDTVRILKNGTSGEVILIDHDDNTYSISFAGSSGWYNQATVRFISRKEPKLNRWYTKEKFMAFMFANPVIFVRSKVVGSIVLSAYPYVKGGNWYINTPEASVARDNYLEYEYTTDGKSWQSFGVEDHK